MTLNTVKTLAVARAKKELRLGAFDIDDAREYGPTKEMVRQEIGDNPQELLRVHFIAEYKKAIWKAGL